MLISRFVSDGGRLHLKGKLVTYGKALRYPVPGELIVVVFGTLISHLGDLHARYGLATVGVIPSGPPIPSLPRMLPEVLSQCLSDALVLAVVSFGISISVSRNFALKVRLPARLQ